ncbi:peptidase M16 [Helicobacter sp. 12S02634-8]|uniref:M16 family metallopeptidase n=1 Tax=Helicobacter sp. 12S02634-8 TaxID=1476199 RepID=UPI000BA6ADB4|nr:pitrilysin family protein [Helicobacter sp. 12S02634-8]PAF47793.1 peptidase M16 [Helicobacter sp. 12S02634-8]
MKNLMVMLLLFLGVYMNANTPSDNIKFYEVNSLKIPVLYEESSLLPIGSIQLVFIGGGSVYDGDKIGLARLGASILNEGTKELGATKFSQALEQKAIDISANAGTQTLGITLNFLKEEQKDAINFLHDLIQSPNLTQDTLKKVQTRTISGLLNKKNDFDYIARETLMGLLFQNTPLAHPALGTIQSVEGIGLADIKAYIRENLALSRLVIIIGGDINIDKTLAMLKPLLDTLPIGQKVSAHHYEANPKSREKILYKDTQQAYIYFGSPFVMGDLKKDAYKAKVMSLILGANGFGSRLMEEIRVKRGLAYSAYMRVAMDNIASYTTGYLQTELKNQSKSIELIKQVIDTFIQKGVTQQELDDAKKFLLGSEPLRNETLSGRLYAKFHNFYLGLPLDFDQTELKQIQDLSLKELNDYIKSHTEIKNLSFGIVSKKEGK